MKELRFATFSLLLALLLSNALLAGDDDGFRPIFDGKTLEGWKAPNMSYWSVQDGAVTAESTEAKPCTSNQFLVWQGGDVADFELKAKFRLAGNRGNSGIQFRSKIDSKGMGIGYQADILPGGPWCGALADEYTGREPLMVPNGHKTIVDVDGKRTCTPMGKPVSLRKPDEWNEYHIVARGHRMVLKINGQVSAEFIDNDAKQFDPSGILALQLRSGPPMKVQFKDIFLKQVPFLEQQETNGPTQMKLWKEIDISDWSGAFPSLGDLDNDGRVDFLLYRQGPQTTPGYMVAVDHDGRKLWEIGDSSIESHSPDGAWREPALRGIGFVYDIDGDDRSEVIAEFWEDGKPMLGVLDGATGKIEAERESPFNLEVRSGKRSRCHPLAMVAFLKGKDNPPSIVMKFEASGRVPTHAVALDAGLETIWHVKGQPTDMGHLPSVGDVDSDGRDEFLLGTTLVDEDGTVRWRQPAQNHADCTAIFQPLGSPGKAALISICNTGPAFCLDPSGEPIWQKTTKEVSHGQGIWAGNFIDSEPGDEVIILKSGHWGDFVTVRGSDGEQLAAFQHRRELKGYPDFPCVVNWLGGDVQSLWIPIDRSLVDGHGHVVADLGNHEGHVRDRLQWGTTKSHVATQAFAVDLCGDEREELVLYQPYNGKSVMIFTQPDSAGMEKVYVPQKNVFSIHSYF